MAEKPSMVMRIYMEDYNLVEVYRAQRGLRTWIQALHELIQRATNLGDETMKHKTYHRAEVMLIHDRFENTWEPAEYVYYCDEDPSFEIQIRLPEYELAEYRARSDRYTIERCTDFRDTVDYPTKREMLNDIRYHQQQGWLKAIE